MTHVPCKGAAPAMTALLAGEVSMFFGPVPQGLPHVRSGKIMALAVTGTARSPLMPEIKTFGELGCPSVVVSTWFGALAPKGTPAPTLILARSVPQSVQPQTLGAAEECDRAMRCRFA